MDSKTLALVALAVAAVIAVPAIAYAENVGSQANKIVKLKTLGTLGQGIATDPQDPMNFRILKIGVGEVEINIPSINETDMYRVGVLWVDDARYRIRNATITNDTVTGIIYTNETEVGSFTANSVVKGNAIIWAGTMILDGKTWNIYILQAPRLFKPEEISDKIHDYCQDNPEKCDKAINHSWNGVGNNFCNNTGNSSCRDKIVNFCRQNPDDTRCTAIKRIYCSESVADARCKEDLKDYCEHNQTGGNQTDEKCQNFELKVGKTYCEKFPDAAVCKIVRDKAQITKCIDDPDAADCQQAAANIKTQIQERMKTLTNCASNPDSEKCEDFCTNYPGACKLRNVRVAAVTGHVTGRGIR